MFVKFSLPSVELVFLVTRTSSKLYFLQRRKDKSRRLLQYSCATCFVEHVIIIFPLEEIFLACYSINCFLD